MRKKITLLVSALTIFLAVGDGTNPQAEYNSSLLAHGDFRYVSELLHDETGDKHFSRSRRKRGAEEFYPPYELFSERGFIEDKNANKPTYTGAGLRNSTHHKTRHNRSKVSLERLDKRKRRCRRYAQQYYKPYQHVPVYVPNYNGGYTRPSYLPPKYIPPQYIPAYAPPKCRTYCVSCPTASCRRRCPSPSSSYPPSSTTKMTDPTRTTAKIILKTSPPTTCKCDEDGSKFPTCNSTGTCVCKPHYTGNTCNTCEDGHWKNQNKDCVKCNCNGYGSLEGTYCDKESGRCYCKPGVTGDDCDACLPHHYGTIQTGCKECDPCARKGHICDPQNGKCVCPPLTKGDECQNCTRNAWGYEPGIGCKSCNCSQTGSSSLQCNQTRGECFCKPGFEGEKCDRCVFGYFGYPECKRCNCMESGTVEAECQHGDCRCDGNGNCKCKDNVRGKNCNTCKNKTFGLTQDNPKGCTPCFCFGRSNKCVDGVFNWHKIRTEKISNDEIAVVDVDYWKLPEKFMGDLTTSYGGYLRVNVPGGYFQVTLGGNGVKLQSSSHNELQFIETNWNVISKNPRFPHNCYNGLTRPCFMAVLQNVTSFLVEANDRIHEVLLDQAKFDTPTYPSSHSVEKCACPKEYTGSSCQDPNEGYFRYYSKNPKDKWIDQVIGTAKPCECNGRSKHCHPNTGQCTNCTEHTTGAHCDLCDVGYYKDRYGNCSACRCPTESQNNAESCSPERDSFICKCKKGYRGQFCDSCDEGYFDEDPSPNSMTCEPCGCNPFGAINGELGLCSEFGICQCKDGFKGEKCNECINERESIKNGVCTPCDECTQLLFSAIDNLTLAVEDTLNLFENGLTPPWKVLTDTMDMHDLLSEKFKKKKNEADVLLQNANLDQCTAKIHSLEEKLKKENQIASENAVNIGTLNVASNELLKEIGKLSKQLRKIIENLENFGTKYVNLKDALERARAILKETEQISERFDEDKDRETFYYCSNITERVNSIYKPPLNMPKQLLEDLKKKLNDVINITSVIENLCNLAEEKNLHNAKRIVKIKEKIEHLKNGKEVVESTVEDIMKKINATNDVFHQLETVYKDLRNISEFKEYKQLENRIKRQMEDSQEIEEIFLRALDHVQELKNKINAYQSMFNFTKDEMEKINASGAYDSLIIGIEEAKKNIELSRDILEKATKILDPKDADNIIDRTNIAQAYSDRLKQRISNLKDISKTLNLVKNKLDTFKYSLVDSGKANNDLNQILYKMEQDITSQSDRVSKLEDVIGNSTSVSNDMQQIEKKLSDMRFTSQHDFFKKYQKYLNLTSQEEINKLKAKLNYTREKLETVDVRPTYFDNIKKFNGENKNLNAIQEKIEVLRNKIYYAKQAADTISVAMNLTNCVMSYKLPQSEIFQSLSITFKCKTCYLFDWSNKHGQSLSLKIENLKPVLTVEDKKITIDNKENKERTVNIQKFGSVIKMQVENVEKTQKIGSYYYVIDSENEIKIGSMANPIKENSYIYKVMLNERNFGLWKFSRTEGYCTGQKREPTDIQSDNVNTYFNGRGYHIYGKNKKLNPSELTLSFRFSTFDENSLIYLAQEDNCAHIVLFLENGYLKLNVKHSNGVTSTLTLNNKYNNGRKYRAEITMEYNRKTKVQQYKLSDTSQHEKQSSNTLEKKDIFKIKEATHYIGGVPPTFNKTCVPVKITSFLGFLQSTSQLTNESLAYGITSTSKELLEFYQAWINKNGYLKIKLAKEHFNSISFILRPILPNGLVMNLTQYVIYLNNYKLHIVGPKSNYTSDTALGKNDYNVIQMSIKQGTLTINEKEEMIPFTDRINVENLIVKIGDTNGSFTGGLSTILINNKELSLNPNTVVEFSNVEIGRELPLAPRFNVNTKSLSSNITNSMQNTEGCATFANYVTDPDAVKFGDKPNSYTYIKSNFWKQDYKISFEFRTFYPNGVIFVSVASHKQQHYNFLELREGKIHLSFKGRRKSAPIIFNNKVNDGQWHNVQIFKKKRKLTIILDGEQKKPYRIPKNVVKDEIYLGGVPSNSNYLNVKELKDKILPFRGCMKSLIINDEHKFLLKNNKDVIHSNIRQCFRNVEEGAYFGGDAYAVYKENFRVNKILELGFEFRTSEQNGILLSISSFRNSPALSIELQNGAIVMAVDMGNGVESNVTNNLDSDIALCNNMWHNITAMYSSSELTVNVDGIRKSWVNNNSVMDEINAPLYVGGLPDNAPIGTLKSRENFKGCIRKLKVEDKLMDWSDMKDLNNVLLNSCPIQVKNKKYVDLETTNYTLIP